MADIPNLAGVATANLVEQISGAGAFKASYINWSRTVNMLREHAPGWMPELVLNEHGSVLHRAPVGAYLLLRFRHVDGTVTPEVPQAIMDHKNKAIPLGDIDARDITDTHRRGVCLLAAFTFGLAYELWAKMPLESGFAENVKPAPAAESNHEANGDYCRAKPEPQFNGRPTDGIWDSVDPDEQAFLLAQCAKVMDEFKANGGPSAAQLFYADLRLTNDEILAAWTQLPSQVRTALKKAKGSVVYPTEKAA